MTSEAERQVRKRWREERILFAARLEEWRLLLEETPGPVQEQK